jgi:hypothetical protein
MKARNNEEEKKFIRKGPMTPLQEYEIGQLNPRLLYFFIRLKKKKIND